MRDAYPQELIRRVLNERINPKELLTMCGFSREQMVLELLDLVINHRGDNVGAILESVWLSRFRQHTLSEIRAKYILTMSYGSLRVIGIKLVDVPVLIAVLIEFLGHHVNLDFSDTFFLAHGLRWWRRSVWWSRFIVKIWTLHGGLEVNTHSFVN